MPLSMTAAQRARPALTPAAERPHVVFVTYNGLLEPLGQTQGLAYVEALTEWHRFTVVSFEKLTGSAEEAERIGALEERLASRGIAWVRCRYHKRPSLPATAYDVLVGARVVERLVRRDSAVLVHARGYVPAAIAWAAHRRTGVPFIFDVRGLQAEEYVDGGLWRPDSLPVRITKAVERHLLRDASGLVTLTDTIRPHLRAVRGVGEGDDPTPSAVVPCCVDLDRYHPDPAARERVRAELGLGDRPVLVYSGTIGTWYLLDEMLRYYTAARERVPGLALLLLVNTERESLPSRLEQAGISPEDYRVTGARPEQVSAYLSAADAGIAFIRPCHSKLASSPTKIGEYLACGLPVVLNSGIGDSDRLAATGAVDLLTDLTPEGIEAAAARLPALLAVSGARSREVAEGWFSLDDVARPRYRALYQQVLGHRGTA